jgi:predicted SprT family Zn-dependent metalloprotease
VTTGGPVREPADTLFSAAPPVSTMDWSKTAAPSVLNACDCGTDDVEVRADGLVKHYRCAGCRSPLGDLTMGHEP